MTAPRPAGTRDRRKGDAAPIVPGTLRIAAELAIGFAILIGVDRLWGAGDAFAGVEPHPYWLPVLLAAMLYGTGPGLAAAAIASLLWVAWSAQVFAPGQDYFMHVFGVARLPLLWTISALGVGEIALSRRRRLDTLVRREAKYARQVDILSRRYRRLNAINQDLQLRIATEDRTVPEAVAQAVALFDGPDRAGTLAGLIALVTGSTAFTVYAADDRDSAVPILSHGPVPAARPSRALVAALRQRTQPVHPGTPADRPLLGEIGLCAVPVRRGRHGAFAGLVLFHHLPAERLTAAGIAGLAALPGWLDVVAGDDRGGIAGPLARAGHG